MATRALQQALFNVITNAEQALDATHGGRIEIGTALEPSLRMIVTTVRDTGREFRPVLPRIFEPFYDQGSGQRHRPRAGHCMHGIVQEHGGEIIAANHPDGGALF